MSCPRPPTSRTKPLPHVEPLGSVRLNFVKAYDKRSILKASAENKADDPMLYIDLEHPRPEFTQMKETELHLGISAKFRIEPQRDSSVKPHIDIYIPKSEIHKFLQAIIQANLRRSAKPAGLPESQGSIPWQAGRAGSADQRARSGGAGKEDLPPAIGAGKGGSFTRPTPFSHLLGPARPTAPQARRGEG